MTTPDRPTRFVAGAASGLASAVLFGISAPLAKLLLPRVDPWMLAGLLYFGAGVGLTILRLLLRVMTTPQVSESVPMSAKERLALIAIAVIGGGVGPVLMLIGLQRVSGVTGALLLNLEAVFTMLLAIGVFRERLTRGERLAAVVILVGAILVSLKDEGFSAGLIGVAAVAGACLAWGLDNNLTARLSHRSAVSLVQFKTMTAGVGNLALALIAGHGWPTLSALGASCAVGFVCYGLSIVLDVYALRYIGAAREAAFFATAPFAGALAAVPLLHEPVSRTEWAGGLVMAAGVIVMSRSRAKSSPNEHASHAPGAQQRPHVPES
jgi:drug/metabolite transporter (DMT)-like permease